jgi:hypothetical protein
MRAQELFGIVLAQMAQVQTAEAVIPNWPRKDVPSGCADTSELSADDQLVDERAHPRTDLVSDFADGLDGLACWVGEFPVEVPLAGEDGTGVAASHGDDDVGALHRVVVGIFGFWAAMSRPTSRMASTATGLTWSAGSEPAE